MWARHRHDGTFVTTIQNYTRQSPRFLESPGHDNYFKHAQKNCVLSLTLAQTVNRKRTERLTYSSPPTVDAHTGKLSVLPTSMGTPSGLVLIETACAK